MWFFLVSAKDMKHAGNILIASLGRQPENTLLHWAGAVLDGFGIRPSPQPSVQESVSDAPGSILAWRNTFMSQALLVWTYHVMAVIMDFGWFWCFADVLITGCVHHGQSSLVLWRGTWCCGLFEVSFVVRPPSRPYMKIRWRPPGDHPPSVCN